MAFVSATPLVPCAAPVLGARLSTTPLARPSNARASTRMGYGDYSYLTDKTKGHVNQYYVDKFRITADFIKGVPASDADAKLGLTAKGAVKVPVEGIPEPRDEALPPIDTSVDPDPRVAESEGQMYPWDLNYDDPQFAPSTYADIDDEDTATNAFAQFRSSLVQDRTNALSAQDFGAVARVNRILDGMDERYILTLDGMLDVRYARAQKIDDPATFTPTGRPQTEIPGTPYLRSVGALDFQPKEGQTIAFWKKDTPAPTYKRPSGNDAPELPYNTAPSVELMQEFQKARNIIPASDE